MRVIYKEEWMKEMADILRSSKELMKRYQNLLDTHANPDREDQYIDRLNDLAEMAAHNLNMINLADIEGDYYIYYIDDDVPGVMTCFSESVRNSVYESEKMTRRMIA